MRIRTKKRIPKKIVRLEISGELKEIIIKEDFMRPNDAFISLCFREKNSSGIIDLTLKEIEMINKEVESKLNLLKGVKVMKFRK